MELEIKPCRTKETYSVKLKKKCDIDMSKLKENFKIKVETPVASVIEIEGEEIIVHKYGEIRFKTLKDKEKIKKISEKIFTLCSTS